MGSEDYSLQVITDAVPVSSIGEVSERCSICSVSDSEAALQSLDPVKQGLRGCFRDGHCVVWCVCVCRLARR